MAPLLEVSNLRCCFGAFPAVDGVSFTVQPAEVFGLLGPNGAGKSTTMMMLCGLLPATSGHVTLDGHYVSSKIHTARRILGVVPQELAVYPELTAEENLQFFGSLYNLSGDLLHQRVNDVLEQVGLTGRQSTLARTFSGGMKRRLNFAAAVLHRPRLLILDEPTVGVDPQSRAHLLECVRHLQQQGTAIIYASHYMEEIESICSRVAVMDHGKILISDTLPNLMAQVPREIELIVPLDVPAAHPDIPTGAKTSITDAGLSVRLMSSASSEHYLNQQLARLITRFSDQKIPLLHIRTHEPSLERLFLELTGTRLRD